MLSCAPLLYRNISVADGGPISSVTSRQIEAWGQVGYRANATLVEGLVPAKTMNQLFGNSDGTGDGPTRSLAKHRAISEALERWAFWALSGTSEARFDIDCSSTGMAAFPGLFSWQARHYAFDEAVERWALASWWAGELNCRRLPSSLPGVFLVEIEHEQRGHVVIAYRRSRSGHVSYGHAGSSKLRTAIMRACSELARNEMVLICAKLRAATADELSAYEKTFLHFASEAGHDEFLARVEQRVTPKNRWKILYDEEVKGPWSKYATVWRVLPMMPRAYYEDRLHCFV